MNSNERESKNHPEISLPTVVGSNLNINGNLTSLGTIHIDGTVLGDIRVTNIVVSEEGTVIGKIISDTVDVHGFVTGDISGRDVILRSTAHVIGDTSHENITIEKGACLDGNFYTLMADTNQKPHKEQAR
jgi:cytoskeletal protein CcmA (bactofilin family)